jgi:hypothetical protein
MRSPKSIWVPARLLLLAGLSVSATALPGSAGALDPSPTEIVFVQTPVLAAGGLTGRFPQGSRLARARMGSQPGSVLNLTTEFFGAADPQVLFDGTKVLFAGKKGRQAHWQIWEMNVDGTDKRQITHGEDDCLRPAYLPRDQVVFTAVGDRGSALQLGQLWVINRDGSGSHPISFGPSNLQVETVLRDGRILVSGSWPVGASASSAASRLLYTLRSDGTALGAFRCEHGQPSFETEAEELDDGTVVFIRRGHAGSDLAGELRQIRQGASYNSPLGSPSATYWSPRRLGPDRLVVARRSLDPRSPTRRFDLYAFDVAKGQLGALVFRDPTLSSVQAVAVAAHPAPRWFWSIVKPELKEGYFICLDSYRSADSPKGRTSTPIANVRVIIQELQPSHARLLGQAPVEKDGSFYLAVPSDVPVRFELLDASGRVIKAQHSWIWTRPGEENGCVGCHESKAVAPPNRWPLTLRRLDTPARLGLKNAPETTH